jgi:hypothetical protein
MNSVYLTEAADHLLITKLKVSQVSIVTQYTLVWSASTHLTEYSLASFSILTLVLARTRVPSTKRVTSGASFKLSKKRVL